MKISIRFKNEKLPKINFVSIINNFNKLLECKEMSRIYDAWIYEFDEICGDFQYKFLINDNLKLNDPFANEYIFDNNELFSRLIIDKSQKRIYIC